MSNKSLFSEFEPVSAKQWKQKIQFDLKGADYNDTLVWESLEGIQVKPFYHADETKKMHHSIAKPLNWSITQLIYAGDAAKANGKAINALKRGAESLLFKIPSNNLDWQVLFQNIDFDTVPVYFDFDFLSSDSFFEFIKHKQKDKAPIFFNIDIIGKLVATGNWYQNLEKDFSTIEKLVEATAEFPKISPLAIDLTTYQNAGTNCIQQLAYGLAHANEYLNHFEGKRLKHLCFKVAVGSNYFFEISKLKALRWLWKTLAKAYGIESDCHIIATPSRRNKTLYDFNNNLLRSTSECMSAVLGGADAIINLPYDAIYHKDHEFSDRIARNQLLLLKKESYFDAVENPTTGNFYIGSITEQLASKALDLFKQIEQSGGFLKQLRDGIIQKKIKASASKEQQLFDDGNIVLVGTNKYERDADRMKSELALYPFLKRNPQKTLIEPVLPARLAETLEQNRLDHE